MFKLDFWKAPTNIGLFADVMVDPGSAELIQKFLKNNQFEYQIIIQDVQKFF